MSFYHTCCWNIDFRHIFVVRVHLLCKLEWYDDPTCKLSYQCENIDVTIIQKYVIWMYCNVSFLCFIKEYIVVVHGQLFILIYLLFMKLKARLYNLIEKNEGKIWLILRTSFDATIRNVHFSYCHKN